MKSTPVHSRQGGSGLRAGAACHASVSRCLPGVGLWCPDPSWHTLQADQHLPQWPLQAAWRHVHRPENEEGQGARSTERTRAQNGRKSGRHEADPMRC